MQSCSPFSLYHNSVSSANFKICWWCRWCDHSWRLCRGEAQERFTVALQVKPQHTVIYFSPHSTARSVRPVSQVRSHLETYHLCSESSLCVSGVTVHPIERFLLVEVDKVSSVFSSSIAVILLNKSRRLVRQLNLFINPCWVFSMRFFLFTWHIILAFANLYKVLPTTVVRLLGLQKPGSCLLPFIKLPWWLHSSSYLKRFKFS